ncbi:hypothetical protein RHMOL_Rhmol10G0026500 [Rhododendron molle]|uniref:Uncharacterized protein n=1 Tax=Rhododendron molle TaxID=49168 RepID=A0ACC0LYB0_RHOML|nr:hypothetical protein RHMOL_Rhmol10G0026500 [Rhododendron molle]
MALTAWRLLLLQPTRVSLSTTLTSPSSLSRSRIPLAVGEKFEPLRRWVKGIEPSGKNHVKRSRWKLCVQRCYANNFCKSGMKFGMWSLFGLSAAFGAICLRPRIVYAMDGFDTLGDEHRVGFRSPTDAEEDPEDVLILARKLLPPAFLFITVLVNWGHPVILVAKIILILLGTKPRPFSVYLFIEQVEGSKSCYCALHHGFSFAYASLYDDFAHEFYKELDFLRQKFIHQQPLLYKFKSLYAKKVEVDDYKFFCLARVVLNNQEFTLIGILGSWWVLPWSTIQEALLIPRNKFLQNYLRN